MRFLVVIPVVFVLAQTWVMWAGRVRREPEMQESVERYERARAALAPGPRDLGPERP